MTKINNLQMKSALSADKRVSIKKGFLGLSKSMVYNNTNSTLKGNAPEYRIEDQRVLNALISANQEELEAAAKKVSKLKTVVLLPCSNGFHGWLKGTTMLGCNI